jgi:glycosyltransferase involved in cell wall biosynthesis
VKYIEACIQSTLNQSYPHIEHIFVDGASNDGTIEVLSRYQDRYRERIRFISEPDKGVGDAWNKGLKMARGDVFGWLGSDDLYEPGAIAAVVDFFRSNPDAYFVFGDCSYINEKGQAIGRHATRDFDLKELLYNEGCCVPTPSSFYRRAVIEKVGFYDTMGNDYDYLVRVAEVFQIHRIKKVLSNFRVHNDSQTGSKETLKMWLRADYLVSRRHGGSIFSRRSRRYYRFAITEFLRPTLGFVYPCMKKLLGR